MTVRGWQFTNRVGERRSMGAFIVLGAVFDYPDASQTFVGIRSNFGDLIKFGSGS